MEGTDRGYGWRVWMEGTDGGWGWRVWMEGVDGGYGWRVRMEGMEISPSCEVISTVISDRGFVAPAGSYYRSGGLLLA